jgi:hypothetical protein
MRDLLVPIVRHALTGLGGALVSNGMLSEGQLTEAVGALVVLFSVGWYAVEKYLAKRREAK